MKRREFLQLSAAGAAAVFVPGAGVGREPESMRRGLQPHHTATSAGFDLTGRGLNYPIAVAVGPDDKVYVLDHGDSQIVVFDREGRIERRIAGWGSGVGGLCYPRSFAFDRSGRLWVADTLNHRVQVFDGFGVSLSCIGGLGSEVGLFNGPTALAFAASGELHVLDAGNRRVQVFSEDGAVLGSYGEGTLRPGASLAIARDGRVYVLDGTQGSEDRAEGRVSA